MFSWYQSKCFIALGMYGRLLCQTERVGCCARFFAHYALRKNIHSYEQVNAIMHASHTDFIALSRFLNMLPPFAKACQVYNKACQGFEEQKHINQKCAMKMLHNLFQHNTGNPFYAKIVMWIFFGMFQSLKWGVELFTCDKKESSHQYLALFCPVHPNMFFHANKSGQRAFANVFQWSHRGGGNESHFYNLLAKDHFIGWDFIYTHSICIYRKWVCVYINDLIPVFPSGGNRTKAVFEHAGMFFLRKHTVRLSSTPNWTHYLYTNEFLRFKSPSPFSIASHLFKVSAFCL